MHQYFLFFTGKKKLIKQRKLHLDKTIIWDFFALLLKNGTLALFCSSGLPQVKKSENVMPSGTI